MQVLNTSKNIILAGVPTDVDSRSLKRILWMGMEEARLRMVARKPSKFGAVSLMPKFALVTDFVKYTPYEERSTETNPNAIPFWSKMPWHIKCHTSDEPKIDALLSYMDRTNRLAQLFGEAAFHHVNPGPKATAGERDMNTGVVTWHIAMVWSMGRVSLKGLNNPDKGVLLKRFDNKDPEELDVEVIKTVHEIMMHKCKSNGTPVWYLVVHSRDKKWVGYFRRGVGNDLHKAYAETWSVNLLAHIQYFLLHRGIAPECINKLIQQSFDYAASILQHYGTKLTVFAKIKASLQAVQLEVGCRGNPFDEDIGAIGVLATECWIKFIWERMWLYIIF